MFFFLPFLNFEGCFQHKFKNFNLTVTVPDHLYDLSGTKSHKLRTFFYIEAQPGIWFSIFNDMICASIAIYTPHVISRTTSEGKSSQRSSNDFKQRASIKCRKHINISQQSTGITWLHMKLDEGKRVFKEDRPESTVYQENLLIWPDFKGTFLAKNENKN